MWTLLFIVTTIILLREWMIERVNKETLLYYIQKKGYPLPTDDEVEECTEFVLKRK
ncbi:MAG: hypothetical protein PHX08_01185 [Lachnospiraceae bacterium]|nr:hypothetical protein [Lachnospiraceae bacterium]